MERLRKEKAVVRFKKPGSCIYVAASTDKETVIPFEKRSGVVAEDEVEESNITHWMVEHLRDDMFQFKSCFSCKYLAYNKITRYMEVLQRDKEDDEDGNHYGWTWSVAQSSQGDSSVVLSANFRRSLPQVLGNRKLPLSCGRRLRYKETMCWKQDHVFLKDKSMELEESFSDEWEVVEILTSTDQTPTNYHNNSVPRGGSIHVDKLLQNPISAATATAAGTFLACNSGQNSNSSGSQTNGDVQVTPSTVICYGHSTIMYQYYQP